MKSELNVLKDYPCRTRYYLLRPWVWIRHTFDNFRAAWQRATRGYSVSDVWDIDHHWLRLMPAMLRELAEKGQSYPGREPFETPEKWESWLNEQADILESLQEDWAETKNEYEEEYFHALESHRRVRRSNPDSVTYDTRNDEDIEALHDKWLARVQELSDQQKETTIKVFSELGRHLYQLWS